MLMYRLRVIYGVGHFLALVIQGVYDSTSLRVQDASYSISVKAQGA